MRTALVKSSLVLGIGAVWLASAGCNSSPAPPSPIDGERALAHVQAMVDIGPRPAGSTALRKCRDYIVAELRKLGLQPRVDSFEDAQNAPNITFHNVEVEIPGTRQGDERVLVLGSHYDTKATGVPDIPEELKGMRFVGANDAGSSSGLLIELARWFKDDPLPCKLNLVWFDGEESLPWVWDDDRALFGSERHVQRLRSRCPKEKDLNQCVPVMVLLDMVGAKDLNITKDTWLSDTELIEIFAAAARELGHGDKFFGNETEVKDDHWPYQKMGIRVIDIIQFGGGSYGVSPWWHTEDDTMDVVSAESLSIVGHVVTVALPRIAGRFYQ